MFLLMAISYELELQEKQPQLVPFLLLRDKVTSLLEGFFKVSNILLGKAPIYF